MGSAYAENLLRAGLEVVGYDVAAGQAKLFEEAGGVAVESSGAVAARSDVVITALPSAIALEQAVSGEEGLAAEAPPGTVLIEMSTLALATKEGVRDTLEPKGVAVIDAPVSGTGLQATTGEVVIYASGPPDALESVGPIFGILGTETFDLGAFGNGSRMKFLANLLVSVHNLATAEAFVLGTKAGLDAEAILQALSAGVGSSRVLEIRGPMMVSGIYDPPAAKLAMFIKDLGVVSEFARSLDVPTPLLDAAHPVYEEAVSAGLGEMDAAALHVLLERRAEVER
ncbi:MAG: NAD(P)-dependent oxidoreductase [Acidimicrobiia bacterium]